MEEMNVISEEIEQISDGQDIKILENYSVADESPENVICGCMQYLGRNGLTYRYVGIRSGCIKAVFSKNGTVRSISTSRIVAGRNYAFRKRSGEVLGFQCC